MGGPFHLPLRTGKQFRLTNEPMVNGYSGSSRRSETTSLSKKLCTWFDGGSELKSFSRFPCCESLCDELHNFLLGVA